MQRISFRIVGVPLLLIVGATICQAADNPEFEDFKVWELGSSVSMDCNTTDSLQAAGIPTTFFPISWMLPNLSMLNQSQGNIKLTDDNWTIIVSNVTQKDFGVYHCMLQNSSGNPFNNFDYYLVKVGLNAEGPYFEDLWEKYMWPTIIGFCAFGGFLILTAIAILLYRYRYISPEEEAESEDGMIDEPANDNGTIPTNKGSNQSYENAYYVPDKETEGMKDEPDNGEISASKANEPIPPNKGSDQPPENPYYTIDKEVAEKDTSSENLDDEEDDLTSL